MTPTKPVPKVGEESALPDPGDRPVSDVVIYDGNCRFCHSQVRLLRRLDVSGILSFLSLHDPRVGQLYPDLSYGELMKQMYVVDSRNRRHGGAGAVRRLSRRLPLLWPVALVLHIPGTMPIWRGAYQAFARVRYRFGNAACESNCEIHSR